MHLIANTFSDPHRDNNFVASIRQLPQSPKPQARHLPAVGM